MNAKKASTSTTNVLIVGCGDLGSAVAKGLTDLGLDVTGVRRSHVPLSGINCIQADVTQADRVKVLELIQPDILIYCIAANGQTDAQYKAAYVDGLRNVLATQTKNAALKHVFFVSSTRVYGQQTDVILDESMTAIPADFGGERLVEAEQLLNTLPCGHSALRLSGIYGPGRLRMINLAEDPARWPAENSWTNRIHRDDAANFMVFLVQQILQNKPLLPCYIVSDCAPVSQYEVLHWLAKAMQISFNANTPLIYGGKRLSNQAMLASGFQLKYADYRAGYGALLRQID
ncbi:MAG: NAD-dependent epimerase/dehydratase family protein [Methylophilaceae bacterium]